MEATQTAQSLPGIGVLEQTPIILEKLLLGAAEETLAASASAPGRTG